jgi:hypothetical protein
MLKDLLLPKWISGYKLVKFLENKKKTEVKLQPPVLFGRPCQIRTGDQLIKSPRIVPDILT